LAFVAISLPRMIIQAFLVFILFGASLSAWKEIPPEATWARVGSTLWWALFSTATYFNAVELFIATKRYVFLS
jgi:hypothetical protein